jgi:succinyl-diaminopimelate desuccinylase
MYEVPTERIIALSKELVAIPSQCCIDDPRRVSSYIIDWFTQHNIEISTVRDHDDSVLGIHATHHFSDDGPNICLNACLDTAPIGAVENWTVEPFGASIKDGWLYGRGAADSKVGASIFALLFLDLTSRATNLKGALHMYLDLVEHQGTFRGIERFIRTTNRRINFVFIGYPGNKQLCVGARGIHRMKVSVHGKSAHTGATERKGENAIEMMAAVVNRLSQLDYATISAPWHGTRPKINVATIQGGLSYSIVPDTCSVGVDCRVTPTHDAKWAEDTVRDALTAVGIEQTKYNIDVVSSYPAYEAFNETYVSILHSQASHVFGRDIWKGIAGPSNIGNAMSMVGIKSTCGFGVNGRSLHGPDEAAKLSDIDNVYMSYRNTLIEILASR